MSEIRIWISDEEWVKYPKEKRERLKKLMVEKYDLDIEDLIKVEKEYEEKQMKKKHDDEEEFD